MDPPRPATSPLWIFLAVALGVAAGHSFPGVEVPVLISLVHVAFWFQRRCFQPVPKPQMEPA